MGYCGKCGAKLEVDNAFCPKCGTPTSTDKTRTHNSSSSLIIGAMVATAAAAIIVIALVVGGFLPTAGVNYVAGSGNLETRQYNFADFTMIQASSGFNLTVTQAESYSIKITADDNLFDKIVVQKNGGALTIQLEPSFGFSNTVLRAEVTLPDIKDIHLSGGAYANASGFDLSHNFNAVLSGGSRLIMKGQAVNLTAVCSGGSMMFLSGFSVQNANVDLSGGSSGYFAVDGRLDANVSGGARLFYDGNPELGDVYTSGGGTINKES